MTKWFMKIYLTFFQIFVSALLIIAILLQSQGGGLGSAFGGQGEPYRSKRGMEKLVFYSTIGLAVLFFVSSILNLVV